LPMNQHFWRPITFGINKLQFKNHRSVENAVLSTSRYFSQLSLPLKT
jgi:hypothetical protein